MPCILHASVHFCCLWKSPFPQRQGLLKHVFSVIRSLVHFTFWELGAIIKQHFCRDYEVLKYPTFRLFSSHHLLDFLVTKFWPSPACKFSSTIYVYSQMYPQNSQETTRMYRVRNIHVVSTSTLATSIFHLLQLSLLLLPLPGLFHLSLLLISSHPSLLALADQLAILLLFAPYSSSNPALSSLQPHPAPISDSGHLMGGTCNISTHINKSPWMPAEISGLACSVRAVM